MNKFPKSWRTKIENRSREIDSAVIVEQRGRNNFLAEL